MEIRDSKGVPVFLGPSITVKWIIKQVLSMERREREKKGRNNEAAKNKWTRDDSRFEVLLKASERRESA